MNKLKVCKNYVTSYVASTKLICEGYNLRKYICEGYNPLKYIYEGYNLRKSVFGSWSGIRSILFVHPIIVPIKIESIY